MANNINTNFLQIMTKSFFMGVFETNTKNLKCVLENENDFNERLLLSQEEINYMFHLYLSTLKSPQTTYEFIINEYTIKLVSKRSFKNKNKAIEWLKKHQLNSFKNKVNKKITKKLKLFK